MKIRAIQIHTDSTNINRDFSCVLFCFCCGIVWGLFWFLNLLTVLMINDVCQYAFMQKSGYSHNMLIRIPTGTALLEGTVAVAFKVFAM